MKLFWYDRASGRGLKSSEARTVALNEAERIWTDEVRALRNSFLGLIDDSQRPIQFMFEEDIPDSVDDSHFLRIIRVDFPCPERNGSFTAMLTGGEVLRWMRDAFERGADPALFDGLSFEPW
jgi:uncharacterized membrane-anchored protein